MSGVMVMNKMVIIDEGCAGMMGRSGQRSLDSWPLIASFGTASRKSWSGNREFFDLKNKVCSVPLMSKDSCIFSHDGRRHGRAHPTLTESFMKEFVLEIYRINTVWKIFGGGDDASCDNAGIGCPIRER